MTFATDHNPPACRQPADQAPAVASPAARPTKKRELQGVCKSCTKCGESKDLSEFAIKRGGRATRCRACQKVSSDANYARNREQRKADAHVRNSKVRDTLTGHRDEYLAQCLCEACSGTVDLQLTGKPGYAGESVHEVIAGARSKERLLAAISNSQVLCKPCMGRNYGGPLAQARRKMQAEAA
ncbi:hypothetical protein D3C71_24600 [compost metagenome]